MLKPPRERSLLRCSKLPSADFGHASLHIEAGRIWIYGETGLVDVDRLFRVVRLHQIASLRIIRLHSIAGERKSPIGLPDYFRIVISLRISPSVIKVVHISISVARQRGGIR